MRTRKKLIGVLCILGLFVIAVAGELSAVSLDVGELGLISGTCGICNDWGKCTDELWNGPIKTWCDGDAGPVWWCIDHEEGFTTCGDCEELESGGCGEGWVQWPGEAPEEAGACNACITPDHTWDCPGA